MLAIPLASCGGDRSGRDSSSITVKLPPARLYVPAAPAFSFAAAAAAGKLHSSN
jgi:hypothetical protein